MTYNLEVLRKLPLTEFLNPPDQVGATRFRLAHVTPRISSQTPDSAAHCFEDAEAGVYDDQVAGRLAAMSCLDAATVHGLLS